MSVFTKAYIHDKLVVLLLALNGFFAFIWSAVIVLRLTGSAGTDRFYIEHRILSAGLPANKLGSALDVVGFILFIWLVLGLVIVLSAHAYRMKRQLALLLLGFSLVITFFTIVVSNGLLALH